MCNEFKNVIEFNNQVINLTCSAFLSKERLDWFKGVINEELGEFEEANNNYIEAVGSHDDYMTNCCRAEMADALIDLLYFAYGRLYEIGIFPEDFKAMWAQVHAANMKKKKGNKGRGSDLDAIKPEGWEAPEKKFFNTGFMYAEEEQVKQPYIEKEDKPAYDYRDYNIKAYVNDIPIEDRITFVNHGTVTGRFPCDKLNYSNPPSTGTTTEYKYDDGKNNLGLVFGGFARALQDVGWLGTFGSKKYPPNSWQKVEGGIDRYRSGLLRHTMAMLEGELVDKESGRLHSTCAGWNGLVLTELQFRNMTKEQYDEYHRVAKKIETEYFEQREAERLLKEKFEKTYNELQPKRSNNEQTN